METTVTVEIIKALLNLSERKQNRVLAFINDLSQEKSYSGKELKKYAGSFSKNDVQEMKKAIETGCENIDRNEW